MNALYQHIEHLLMSHDCVVVPHFGGFVAHNAEARYVESEALFFPPVRLVRFNADLTISDGLLLSHLCRVNDYTESEGKRAIQAMVLQLRSQLLAEGQVDFGSLGVFSQDDDGDIQFSACQAGALTPAYYGLDAFSMPRLATLNHSSAKRRRIARDHEHEEHQFITLHISRRAIRRTLIAAAVLLAAVLFAVPIDLVRRHHLQTASLFPSETLSISGKSAKTETPAVAAPAQAVQPASAEPSAQNATTATAASVEKPAAVTPQADNNFALVFASNVSLKNAQNYAKELCEKGFSGAHILQKGNNIRVVIDGIATETEAYNQVREIHAMGPEFADVWVLKL